MKHCILILSFLLPSILHSQIENQTGSGYIENQTQKKESEDFVGNRLYSISFFEKRDEYYKEKRLEFEKGIQHCLDSLEGKKKKSALKVHAKANLVVEQIEDLRKDLISEACGQNCILLQEEDLRNTQVVNWLLFERKEGEKLRKELESLLDFYRNYELEQTQFEIYKDLKLKPLDVNSSDERYKSWEGFCFKNVPLFAVLPELSKIQNGIRQDELLVLKNLK